MRGGDWVVRLLAKLRTSMRDWVAKLVPCIGPTAERAGDADDVAAVHLTSPCVCCGGNLASTDAFCTWCRSGACTIKPCTGTTEVPK